MVPTVTSVPVHVKPNCPGYRMSKHCTDEILLSSDKTNAVVDGSGVLSDLAGIKRAEVVRLVKLRKLVKNFDKSKLSKDGYLVCVDD